MSFQYSSSYGNLLKRRSKKCMSIGNIPFRLALTCTFSSLFVFTPTPHPANQTSQQPLGLMVQSLETEQLMTLKLLDHASLFPNCREISRNVLQLWMGWIVAVMPSCQVWRYRLVSCAAAAHCSRRTRPSSSFSPVVPPVPPGARAPYILRIHQLSKEVFWWPFLLLLCRAPQWFPI